MKRIRKAQHTLEYAVVICCAVAGLLTMSMYIKRGLSGRWRTVADDIGEQYLPRTTYGTENIYYSQNTNSEFVRAPGNRIVVYGDDGTENWSVNYYYIVKEYTNESTAKNAIERVGRSSNLWD